MLVPVIDHKTGLTVLHDIYVSGMWIGSRRTEKQAREALDNHIKIGLGIDSENST